MFPEVTWNDIPEYIVNSLDIIRHPLNPNQVPFEVIVLLSQKHPEVLPELSWDMFEPNIRRELQKRYTFLKDPVYGVLPS